MKVSEQCGIAASKGNNILGLIRRNITYMTIFFFSVLMLMEIATYII